MTDWNSISLLGIDVGFSVKIESTGIAIYDQGRLAALTCIGSSPRQRAEAIPPDLTFDAVAIDGPIVTGTDPPSARACERLLSSGKFSRRCKPGLSHFGFGLPLRAAATCISAEMQNRVKPVPTDRRAIVEAFPNAFLGVLIDDGDYAALGPIKRGRKSDIYYARVAATGRFEAILDNLAWTDSNLLASLQATATANTRAAHDQRAALICLLTAAYAVNGTAEYVGDQTGGYICLPPKALWAAWACDALDNVRL